MIRTLASLLLTLVTLALAGCGGTAKAPAARAKDPSKMNVTTAPFGKTSDGKEATAYTLTNATGMKAVLARPGAFFAAIFPP